MKTLEPDGKEYFVVVEYIAGFVVYKINKTVKCEDCLKVLEGESRPQTLQHYKTKGYLKTPSKDVVVICKIVESELRAFEQVLNEENLSILRNKYFTKIVINCLNKILLKKLFNNNHMTSSNHYSLLIKSIVEKYLRTRYFFISRKMSEKQSIRNKLTKIILFKGH